MVFIVGLGIIMAAALVVCVPLMRESRVEAVGEELPDVAFQWEKQKRDALSAIKEAELDHQMGKLSPADYAAIRAVQEDRALEAMKALDRRGGPHAVERACAACGTQSAGTAEFCAACGGPLAA